MLENYDSFISSLLLSALHILQARVACWPGVLPECHSGHLCIQYAVPLPSGTRFSGYMPHSMLLTVPRTVPQDPVNTKEYKYVFLAATSAWKSESDLQK